MMHTDALLERLKTAGALPEVGGPAVDLAQAGQLHDLMAKRAGVSTFDMDSVLKELGRKIYLKNASWSVIRDGLRATENL